MNYSVRITAAARRDIRKIAQAITFDCGLTECPTVRISGYKKYSIFYNINERESRVVVFAVLYGAMDLPSALKKRNAFV